MRSDAIDKESLQAFNSMGIAYATQGKFSAAAAYFKKALNIAHEPGVRANYANVLRRLWRFDEAQAELDKATPNDFTHFVQASIYLETGNPRKAAQEMACIDEPDSHIQFCRAMAYLQDGDWDFGFRLYEARLEINKPLHTALPRWEGQKGIVLAHHEQGYGDTLMMSRFVEPDHILSVPSPLYRLFKYGSPFNTVSMNAQTSKADYITPLMSLPYRLGITEIAPPAPYLHAPEEYPIPRPRGTKLTVGIVWTAKATGARMGFEETLHGQQKSIPLELLLPLATIPGVSLYGLQTGEAAKDITRLGADHLVLNLGNAIMDFADLAGFMASMDIVISVDTAPLHLAGAMNKPAFGILSYPRSWQWHTGPKTPWYRSIETIAQPTPFDWKSVVDTLMSRLEAMA